MYHESVTSDGSRATRPTFFSFALVEYICIYPRLARLVRDIIGEGTKMMAVPKRW